MSTMSWQGGVASGSFLIGTVSQGLLTVNRSSYSPEGWHGTLFIIAVVFVVVNINVFGARALPFLQNILFVLHVFAFTAIVIILWVVARVRTSTAVFTQFENHGGWNSMGLTLMVGQVNAVYLSICASASHLSASSG
jgi:amino acid transporter